MCERHKEKEKERVKEKKRRQLKITLGKKIKTSARKKSIGTCLTEEKEGEKKLQQPQKKRT